MSETIELEQRYQVEAYKKFPFVIESGKGSYVFTDEGAAYLDMYGGHAVCATGHCHPAIVAAISEQASKLIFYSNLVHLTVRAKAAEALIRHAPHGITQAFFVNTGSESNDNAIKIARKYTGRRGIVSFSGSFHGRSLACLSATGLPKYRHGIYPTVSDHFIAEWENLAEVQRLFELQEIAGIILEPIQSMGGIRVASPKFLQGLRALCDQHNAILIYDEIQTGFGRAGSFYYAGKHDVVPDLICLGKSIASGFPMGAILFTDSIANTIKFGDLGTTFGGGPLACAALLATVAVLETEGFLQHVATAGNRIKSAISACPQVLEFRGEGFLMGIRLSENAQWLQHKLLQEKIITGLAEDPRIIRLLPPLSLSEAEIDIFIDTFKRCMREGKLP